MSINLEDITCLKTDKIMPMSGIRQIKTEEA